MERKVVLYIAMSLDGYIARSNMEMLKRSIMAMKIFIVL